MNLLLLIIISGFLTTVLCWTNYRLFFRALKIDYVNKKYLDVHKFTVESYNRSHTYILYNATLLKTVADFMADGQFFKYQNNIPKEHFVPLSTDLCPLISNKGNGGRNDVTKALLSAFGGPLKEILNTNGNKFPRSCPMTPQDVFIKFYLNEDWMPNFFLPQGKWRLWAKFRDGNVTMLEGYINFEVVEYSSEKQKKRMG